jgi:hypothetical protein
VGFVLQVSTGSFGYGIAGLVFAGVLAALPFRLGAAISSESFRGGHGIGWILCAAVWLFLVGAAVFASLGQIRVTKTGDHGEIFSGLGPLGRTRRFEWSDFPDVRDREFTYTGTRATRTGHDIQLSGASASYRFGKGLDDAPRAFIVAFLREEARGRHDAPGTGRMIAMDRVQESLDQSRRYYSRPDPQRFASAIDELSTSLRSQFGDHVPAGELARRLDKLGADTGMRIRIEYLGCCESVHLATESTGDSRSGRT